MKEREREKADRTEPGWSWSEPRGRRQQDFERRKNGMETRGRVGPRGCSLLDIMSLSASPASQPLAPNTGCPVWGWSMGSRPQAGSGKTTPPLWPILGRDGCNRLPSEGCRGKASRPSAGEMDAGICLQTSNSLAPTAMLTGG